jgi:hypothetical protein
MAAQKYAREKEVRDLRNHFYDEAMKRENMTPAQAEDEANRQMMLTLGMNPGPRPAAQAGPGGADPLANVPKELKKEGYEELRAHKTGEKIKQTLARQFADFDRESVLFGGREALKASIANMISQHLRGASSDKDFENKIEPLIPKTGQTDEVRNGKLRHLQEMLDAGTTTPALDQYSPGWRKASSVEADEATGFTPGFGAKK